MNSLQTAPAPQQVIYARRSELTPSLTNRKNFNQSKLLELAETMKPPRGIDSPIIVRKLPGSRMQDTWESLPPGASAPIYEIGAGERRWLASGIAGLEFVPIVIRELTDEEMLDLQMIENLHRVGLTPLEEAEALQHRMQSSGLNAQEVGVKIGRSREYVYARIKLLDLCQEARTSLRDGIIDASCALLVARIPDHKLQIKAMKEIVAGHTYYGSGKSGTDPLTTRQAAEHVQNNYMLKLSTARFDIACETLIPAAGSCKKCPKRTGHNPDLFSDVKSADVCTDPPCFHKKEEAHAAIQIKEAKAKGQTVISGKEAQELMTQGYNAKFKGYRRLDVAEDSPTDQPLRKIIGKQMVTEGVSAIMIEHPQKKGELVATLPNEVALRLLKTVEGQAQAAKTVAKEVREFANEKKAKAESKATSQYEQDWRNQLMARTWRSLGKGGTAAFTFDVHRYLALKTANSLSTEQSAALCQLLDLGKVAPHTAVIDFVTDSPDPDLLQLLMIMLRDSSAHDHSYNGRIANEGLNLVAGIVFKDALPDVVKEIKAESYSKYFPKVKAEKPPIPTTPLAQPSTSPNANAQSKPTPRGKAKLSAADAQSGIADALQGIESPPADGAVPVLKSPVKAAKKSEPAPPASGALALEFELGQQVKVTTDTDKLGLMVGKYAGKTGTITQREPGGGFWDVTFKGRNGGVATFAEDQIEAVV
ncbi:MAG: ParB/RepB/Spo0J family partition protein [Polaromonas sp.]|nr:ParB/RepB/Spo0J family partition protein [Polaromonas sp.]